MSRRPLAVGEHGKITIREKSPKVWEAQCRVRDPDGELRRVRLERKTQTAANQALQRALKDRPGFGGSGIDRETRVHVVADLWLARMKARVETGDLAPNSYGSYESVWRNHVKPAIGGLRLREATTGRIDDLLLALRRKYRSAATAKTARAIISGIQGYAVRAGAITTNAVREASPISSKGKPVARALTTQERQEWLDAVTADEVASSHDIPALSRFLLCTGVRIGEALAVEFADIDFEAGAVAINHHIIRVTGHGLVRAPSTKGGSGDRLLWLTPWTAQMLADRRKLLGEGPVFPSSVGTWRDPSNTGKTFRKARSKAGFDWVTSHVFRKTVATVLEEGGLTGREIADQLGHSKVSMTYDTYLGRRAVSRAAVAPLAAAEERQPGKPGGI